MPVGLHEIKYFSQPKRKLNVLGLMMLLAIGLATLVFVSSGETAAFGKNKLHTRDLDWQIFETDHFEIHYYPEEEPLAREVCQIAEAAYAHDTRLFRFKLHDKNPLFIYRDQIDFQQTNILPSVIGVGTGGFTEAFKNRIALPAPVSTKTLTAVIYHEFVHALQFTLLYGEGFRSFRIYKGYLIPEWIIEGMAEYAAQDWDSTADMIVRDAILHDRFVPLTLLDGFNHLEDVYLAYKESQLAVRFLADRYGEDKVATVFKGFKSQISLSQILRESIGIGLQEFNDEYFYWVKQHYWVQANGKDKADDYGPALEPLALRPLTITTGATWSPDGRWLAFISNQDQTMKIHLKEVGKPDPPYPVTNRIFEYFIHQGNALAWSPDSKQLAFVARDEGKTRLYFLTLADRSLVSWEVPIEDIYSPAWSPAGNKLALAGVKNGIGDIYLWELDTRKFQQLTFDRNADDTPIWSQDGKFLIYATERNAFWQLARLELNADQSPQPLTHMAFQHQNPVLAPDGKSLYFSGDANGIFNLYQLDLSSLKTVQLTDINSGVFQPGISPDGQRLAFTTYEAGSWQIHLVSAKPVQGNTPTAVFAWPGLDEHKKTGEGYKIAAFDQGESSANTPAAKTRPRIISSRPYQFSFSPDLLFILAGYDSTQGLVGGGYLTASDYLGDHSVSLLSEFVPGYQSTTQLSYMNFSFPINFGISALYQRYYYRIFDLETQTLLNQFNDEEVGGALLLSRPFSIFDRLETEFALRHLRRESSGDIINQRVSSVQLALIHDDTVWQDFEPCQGSRTNLSLLWADQWFGGQENYSILQLDAQNYQNLAFLSPQLVWSSRLLLAASAGPDHPLFLFGGIGVLPGTGTLRGYNYGELLGSQVGVCTFELRFPLARNVNYTLWPLDFLLMKDFQMVLFDDLGMTTNNFREVSESEVKNSIGIGFRLHTFLLGKQLLTIRFDISKRTTYAAEPIYTWGIGQAF